MRLVSASYVSDEDHYIQSVLCAHPILKWHLTLLLNMYRELCIMSFDAILIGETDIADGSISLSKKDVIAQRYGIPLFENLQDWTKARLELDKARDDEEKEA